MMIKSLHSYSFGPCEFKQRPCLYYIHIAVVYENKLFALQSSFYNYDNTLNMVSSITSRFVQLTITKRMTLRQIRSIYK